MRSNSILIGHIIFDMPCKAYYIMLCFLLKKNVKGCNPDHNLPWSMTSLLGTSKTLTAAVGCTQDGQQQQCHGALEADPHGD